MIRRNNKGAMEMSVGTIVTIVLLMSVLVLGIFFISKIFTSGGTAIDSVDSQLTNQINQLFSDGSASKIAVYPNSREIDIKKGDSPKGFAFSVNNNDKDSSSSFDYSVEADNVDDCGQTMTKEKANTYILGGTGTFTLGPTANLDQARLVRFSIPESAVSCTIFYNVNINRGSNPYTSSQIIVNIK